MQEVHLQLLVHIVLLEVNNILHNLNNQCPLLRLDDLPFHFGCLEIIAHEHTFLVVLGQFLLEFLLLSI